ncbi:MAG: hypothetical protein ACRDPH_12015 [Marmoricola sp.]
MLRVIIWVLVLAAITYAVFWMIERRSRVMGHHHRRNPGPRRDRGPLGPDDDEEFLRELDRKRRGE